MLSLYYNNTLLLVGGESHTRASITVSLAQEDIYDIEKMAVARGVGFSAMASILLTQGRARLAEMEERHGTAMERDRHPESGKGTDTLRQAVGTKRKRAKSNNKGN